MASLRSADGDCGGKGITDKDWGATGRRPSVVGRSRPKAEFGHYWFDASKQTLRFVSCTFAMADSFAADVLRTRLRSSLAFVAH